MQACRHSGILLVVSIYRQNSRRSRSRQRRAGNTTGLTVAQSSASRVNVWHDIWVLHTLEQRKATLTPQTISFMGRFLANLGFPGILSPLPFEVENAPRCLKIAGGTSFPPPWGNPLVVAMPQKTQPMSQGPQERGEQLGESLHPPKVQT